jgi:hypothetical protein
MNSFLIDRRILRKIELRTPPFSLLDKQESSYFYATRRFILVFIRHHPTPDEFCLRSTLKLYSHLLLGGDNIKIDLREIGFGLDSYGSGQGTVEGSCEHGTETSGCIKC